MTCSTALSHSSPASSSVMPSGLCGDGDWMAEWAPDAVVQLRARQSMSPVELAKRRGQVRRQVAGCRECWLSGQVTPTPYHGPPDALYAVVGEAPGPEEARRGQPFVGPSGRLLRALMDDVGIEQERGLWLNAASCFPQGEKGKVRAPNPNELAACKPNLTAQLELCPTPFVLLVGGKALDLFRSDIQVTRVHGQVFVWNDTWVVMPIIHPASVLRGAKYQKEWIRQDLYRFAELIDSLHPTDFFGDVCVKCGQLMSMLDRDAVPYCERHYGQWGGLWQKERRARGTQITQITLL